MHRYRDLVEWYWLRQYCSVICGYSFINFPRQSHNRGDGTGILFRDSLKVSLVDGKENKSFEFSEWTVKVHDRSMRYVIVYRPPYSSLHPVLTSVFFDEFSQFLENVVMCPEVLVISGDFNLHLDMWPPWQRHQKFMDLLETFSLSQRISGPTHLLGHTLDLIITRSSDDIVLASPRTTFPISDHFIIQCPIGFSRPALSCKKPTFRKLKSIDISAFSADVASSMLCVSVHWDNWHTDILDKFAPLKTRTMTDRPMVPWFNDDIKQLERQRRGLEKRAVKTDLPGDWNNYHKVRNQYSAFLKSARVNYYSNLIDQCAGDFRKLLTPQS